MNAQLVTLLQGLSGWLVDQAVMPAHYRDGQWTEGYIEGVCAARELLLAELERGELPAPQPPPPHDQVLLRGDQLLLAGRELQAGDEIELWLDGAWRRVRVEVLDDPPAGQPPLMLRALDWSGKFPTGPTSARWPGASTAIPPPSDVQACAARLIEAVRAIDIPYESPLPRGVARANLAACELEELLLQIPGRQTASAT